MTVVGYILLGILIGWLVEWGIDLLFWRRRMQQLQDRFADAQRSLEEARERAKMLQAKLNSLEGEQKSLRGQIAQLEAELDRTRNERDAAQQQLRQAPSSTANLTPTTDDDLQRIEGVGPKIEELLKRAGIRSFRALAATSVEHLREILNSAGRRFQLADPTTWPRQAEMAAAGRWKELEDYQDALQGGRES